MVKSWGVEARLFKRYGVLYKNVLKQEQRVQFASIVREEISRNPVPPTLSATVLILGDGCDRTLMNTKREVLLTPQAEMLAPMLRAQRDKTVFVLNLNVTCLYEYLVKPIHTLPNYAELYGNIFTSITPGNQTCNHKHVISAKNTFAAFVNSFANVVGMEIKFLGVGFTRNDDGLRIVLEDFRQRFMKVSFYNKKSLNQRQLDTCRMLLGGTEIAFTKQRHCFCRCVCKYLRENVRWEIPTTEDLTVILDDISACAEFRLKRMYRAISPTDVQEQGSATIPQALTRIYTELGKRLPHRKRKRRRVVY